MRRAARIGSAPDHAGAHRLTAVDPATPLEATIVLRAADATAAPDLLTGGLDEAPRAATGANANALEAVAAFARAHGLTVVESSRAERRVVVRGAAVQFGEAFGTTLAWFETGDGHRHLSYDGALTLPAELIPYVLAVLGLDQRSTARPR
jgi:kumamolisin